MARRKTGASGAGRCVIYARYSSNKQREESIEDQVRVCSEAARRDGMRVVHIYKDEATSGTEATRRQGFLRMVADSKAGGWEAVYVYKLDRFARNRTDSAIYRAELSKAHVRLVTAAEPIPEGPEGVILEALLEGMAEYHSMKLSMEVMRGMEGNAMQCKHNGVRCFGYDLGADGLYHVNDEQARAVRLAFAEYAKGTTMPEIVRMLEPYKTVGGKAIGVQAVSKMLRREKYIGNYEWNGIRTEGGMEAIVDRATWDAVQQRLDDGVRQRPRKDSARFMLTGRLFDADGNAYRGTSGHSGHGGAKYCYYQCAATGRAWPRDDVEGAVREAVMAYLSAGDEFLEGIADLVLAAQDDANAADIQAMDAMRERLDSIERETERLLDLAMRVDEHERIAARMGELRAEREGLAVELADLERGVPLLTREMVMMFLRDARDGDGPQVVMEAFVRRVTLHDDGVMDVGFIFDGDSAGGGGVKTPEPPAGGEGLGLVIDGGR